HAFALEADHQRLELADEPGGQTLRRLVEHEQLWIAGERAGDGQHLLLAAGQAAAALPPALAQDGEVLEDPLERPARAVAGGTRGQAQILADVEVGKDLTSLGDVADPESEHAMRRLAGDVLALEAHAAGPGRREPHDRPQRRRLAGAVASEEHGDLARR